MRIFRRLLSAGTGYGLSVVISGILSIAVIPAVIIVAGPVTWGVIAVAQAVGGFGFVVTSAGWGVTGPTAVASRPVEARGDYYARSLVTRGWLLMVTLVPSIFIAVALTGHDAVVGAFAATTSIVAALSAGWFYVGEAKPMRFLLIETLPRILGTALGALALLVSHQVLWFLGLQLAGALASTLVATVDILRRHEGWQINLGPLAAARNLRGHGAAVTMSATTAIYVNLPIVIVQVFLPTLTPVYALGERMTRLALYSTRPLVQVAQGYVPAPEPERKVRRAQRVLRWMALVSVVGGLLFSVLGPLVGNILSGWELDLPFTLTVPLGIGLAAMLLSQVTGFACLTAFDSDRTLATSTAIGAIVGVVLFVPLALLWQLPGVAWALALSEVLVLIVQWRRLRSLFREVATAASAPTES